MPSQNVIPLLGRRMPPARLGEPQTYTPEQVATMLGLSLTGTYQHLRDGVIPARKLGARWIIPRKRFHEWLDGAEVSEVPGPTDPWETY